MTLRGRSRRSRRRPRAQAAARVEPVRAGADAPVAGHCAAPSATQARGAGDARAPPGDLRSSRGAPLGREGALGVAPDRGANGLRRRALRDGTAIVELVVAGRTNREVAEELSLSPNTVAWNLSKIYRKLGVRSRTELAARIAATPPAKIHNFARLIAGTAVRRGADADLPRRAIPPRTRPRVARGGARSSPESTTQRVPRLAYIPWTTRASPVRGLRRRRQGRQRGRPGAVPRIAAAAEIAVTPPGHDKGGNTP